MGKFTKVLLACTGTLWFLILVLHVANHFDRQRDKEMYERGVMQTVTYHACMNKYPSAAFRDEMWNMVNMPKSCAYIKAVDETIAAKHEREKERP